MAYSIGPAVKRSLFGRKCRSRISLLGPQGDCSADLEVGTYCQGRCYIGSCVRPAASECLPGLPLSSLLTTRLIDPLNSLLGNIDYRRMGAGADVLGENQ